MQVTIDVNRRNTIRALEMLCGVAACVLGIATFLNALPWQTHLYYATGSTFSMNVLTLAQTGGFAAYSIIGISLLLLVIAAAAIFHAVRHSSISRVILLVAAVGLTAFVALMFGTLLLLSVALGVGAAALSFAWR